MSERRRHTRHGVKVLVFVRDGDDVIQKWVEIQTRDVSLGGLCFETGRDVPVEADAFIMVGRLGGDIPDSAQIHARVAHSQLVDGATNRYRLGLEFEKMVDVTAEQLSRRIDEWLEGREHRRGATKPGGQL